MYKSVYCVCLCVLLRQRRPLVLVFLLWTALVCLSSAACMCGISRDVPPPNEPDRPDARDRHSLHLLYVTREHRFPDASGCELPTHSEAVPPRPRLEDIVKQPDRMPSRRVPRCFIRKAPRLHQPLEALPQRILHISAPRVVVSLPVQRRCIQILRLLRRPVVRGRCALLRSPRRPVESAGCKRHCCFDFIIISWCSSLSESESSESSGSWSPKNGQLSSGTSLETAASSVSSGLCRRRSICTRR
jgi:hypothetical protein